MQITTKRSFRIINLRKGKTIGRQSKNSFIFYRTSRRIGLIYSRIKSRIGRKTVKVIISEINHSTF
jgi:hypothetical protein